MPVVLDTSAAVRRAAMDLLARREHGRAELARKLRQRGAAGEMIDAELERLAEEGLLSDQRFLECFIRSRANAGYGPLRIRDELGQRGLPRSAVERALADSGIDWADNLRQLWRRRFAGLPQDARERAKQGRFLLQRGFALEGVNRLLRGGGDE
ncbi:MULTISPECIES: recombination regulator RecX [unclassified Pseudomonas]|uniref:recombination regulator RecX n=1 Tax=unclassified Pseudomonas TaxID=196821 RepID=UPI0019192A1D|nr:MULTISPECIES: recombination regulator RecX [unclassified Pseudomonas]WPP47754.1 recombination regulator RecX [Pseudomonas sp. AN-1]